jgi:DNA-binding NarL/FixJ family response regulator
MKAYIVDDNEAMRIILKRVLKKRFPQIRFVGQSGKAERALEEIPGLGPDMVLVDISLPGMDGIEMVRRLRHQGGAQRVLVVTGHEPEMYAGPARAAGADGIVSKFDDDQLLELVEASLKEAAG